MKKINLEKLVNMYLKSELNMRKCGDAIIKNNNKNPKHFLKSLNDNAEIFKVIYSIYKNNKGDFDEDLRCFKKTRFLEEAIKSHEEKIKEMDIIIPIMYGGYNYGRFLADKYNKEIYLIRCSTRTKEDKKAYPILNQKPNFNNKKVLLCEDISVLGRTYSLVSGFLKEFNVKEENIFALNIETNEFKTRN